MHDLRDQLPEMTIPVLLAVGDDDVRCHESNLMLKSADDAALVDGVRFIWSRTAVSAI